MIWTKLSNCHISGRTYRQLLKPTVGTITDCSASSTQIVRLVNMHICDNVTDNVHNAVFKLLIENDSNYSQPYTDGALSTCIVSVYNRATS